MCHGHLNEAVGVLIALVCYLRVGDLFSLTFNDFVFTEDKKQLTQCHMRKIKPKQVGFNVL